MSLVVAEAGEAFCLTEENWSEFLALKASGASVSVADFGIGIGDFVVDVTAITPDQARRLIQADQSPSSQQLAAA